jgi:hypothetical protein
MEQGSVCGAWRAFFSELSASMFRDDRPPLFINPFYMSEEYCSRASRIAFDKSKQLFSRQWNIRHLASFMCCIEQTNNYQNAINITAPPASQNLVKGGSP